MIKNQNLIIAIVVSIILGLSVLGYGYLNYKSKQENLVLEQEKLLIEKQRVEQQEKSTQEKEQKFIDCKQNAEDRYKTNWNKRCTDNGKDEGCQLPNDTAEGLYDKRRDEIEDCVKLYSVIQ